MSNLEDRKPPKENHEGELGDELMVLSLPVIRTAEKLLSPGVWDTADGKVQGSAGDFLLKTEKNELYPIRDSVFYGTYQILGRVGTRYVCQRQLQVRRAWEAISEKGVEFFYSPQRGGTHGPKGSWVYQCDDDDYGLINADEKHGAHIELGTVKDLSQNNHLEDAYRTSWLVALLPPVLTLIAIFAYTAAMNKDYAMSALFLAGEAIILAGGVLLVWIARKQRWFLKAAVGSATKEALDFQLAVQLLGRKSSGMFPSMALWRAAQMKPGHSSITPAEMSLLKEKVFTALAKVAKEIHHHHQQETWGERLAWGTAVLIVICIGVAIRTHSPIPEVIAILLPSIVTSVHAYLTRRQTVKRIDAGRTFLAELKFVSEKLTELTRGPNVAPNSINADELNAILRLLCKAVARHTQSRFEFILRDEPNLPL